MKTNELLQLQALKFKERVMEDRPDFDEVDGMPAWMRDNYDANAETRNICAMIPVALLMKSSASAVCSVSASGAWSKWLCAISPSVQIRLWMRWVSMLRR